LKSHQLFWLWTEHETEIDTSFHGGNARRHDGHGGSRWQGPGWYQVVEKAQPGHDSQSVIYRPTAFASREECQATLPVDRLASGHDEHRLDTYYDFSCVELQGRPDWDR
jgi:hypothetical protein